MQQLEPEHLKTISLNRFAREWFANLGKLYWGLYPEAADTAWASAQDPVVLPSDLEMETAEEKLCVLPVDAGEFGQIPSSNVSKALITEGQSELEGNNNNGSKETKPKSKKVCICDNISDRGFYACISSVCVVSLN